MEHGSLDRGVLRTAALLRVQLAQIVAASEMLESTVQDAKGRQQLATLDQSVFRMLRIVGRMELTCRLESDDIQLDPSYCDLIHLVRSLGAEMAELLASIGVELTVHCPDELTAVVEEGLIRQMLLELTANSAKAGSRVVLSLAQSGENAVFSVMDNGPGVPLRKINEIFSGSGPEIPDWRSTGNGVAIAKRIAELHGGRLVAVPVQGHGLRVVATIPLRPQPLLDDLLESPSVEWEQAGFSEVKIAFSDLLPLSAFGPEEICREEEAKKA